MEDAGGVDPGRAEAALEAGVRMEEEQKDYREEYEREKVKSAYLADRVAQLEDQVDDLTFRLNRIRSNPLWKASLPARNVFHWAQRTKERITNQGSLRGVLIKIDYKKREKQAMSMPICGLATPITPRRTERRITTRLSIIIPKPPRSETPTRWAIWA